MNIIYRFDNNKDHDGYAFNVVAEAKCLCKQKGYKIKDLRTIRLTHMPWGMSMALFTKDGKFMTNCAF